MTPIKVILPYRTSFGAVDASYFGVFLYSCIILRTLFLYLSISPFLLSAVQLRV